MINHAVQLDSAVLLHFDLKLADGQLADSTQCENKPALFGSGPAACPPSWSSRRYSACGRGTGKASPWRRSRPFGPSNLDLIQFYSRRNFIETGMSVVGTIMLFTGIINSEMLG